MNVLKSVYGVMPEGRDIDQFTLENDQGMVVKIINYGGIITNIMVPDKNGDLHDVVLGFDNLESYLGTHPYFGAIIGRYANRIANGRFELNGKGYTLAVNNGPNHLHGGIHGFDKKVWFPKKFKNENEVGLKLTYLSEHLEEGYPGNLQVEVDYALNNNNELIIRYKAETDMDTHINLTNHSYFNLNSVSSNVLKHKLIMACDRYTPVDDTQIPTGEIRSVDGTAFDFLEMKEIGRDFGQLENGYDHNFIINKEDFEMKWFARVEDPESGRIMEVGTTQPGVQFYTSNFLKDVRGKNSMTYQPQDALCLETQHYPDSPNHPRFPSTLLKPNEEYRHTTIYKFGVK
ncbi:MAG TPA: aldose epimerase family protein [Bacteroidales bacterium]|nr:aldose epimerase family protein [Bacteroidales bacterium]